MGIPRCGKCARVLPVGVGPGRKVMPKDPCLCAGVESVVRRAEHAQVRLALGRVDRRPLWVRALESRG